MRSTILLLTAAVLLTLTLPEFCLQAGSIDPALLGPNRFVLAGDSVDVWVTFNDRGFTGPEALVQALRQAESSLLPRARDRRAKMHRASLVGETDLPVNATYVHQVLGLGARYRAVSRTINAVSVRLPSASLETTATLPFVAEVRPVAKGRLPLPDPS